MGGMSSKLDTVTWPVRTDRLSLRRATLDDLEATWQCRRLENVNRWLTRAPATLEEHRTQFDDADRLSLVFPDGTVVEEEYRVPILFYTGDTDRGLLVLCDPRLKTKSYGRKVLAALPPMPRVDRVAALEWLRTL